MPVPGSLSVAQAHLHPQFHPTSPIIHTSPRHSTATVCTFPPLPNSQHNGRAHPILVLLSQISQYPSRHAASRGTANGALGTSALRHQLPSRCHESRNSTCHRRLYVLLVTINSLALVSLAGVPIPDCDRRADCARIPSLLRSLGPSTAPWKQRLTAIYPTADCYSGPRHR